MPGRVSAVHCMDVPRNNSGTDSLIDFPGDIIRLHESEVAIHGAADDLEGTACCAVAHDAEKPCTCVFVR